MNIGKEQLVPCLVEPDAVHDRRTLTSFCWSWLYNFIQKCNSRPDEELHNLHAAPDIIKVMIPSKASWVGMYHALGRWEIRTKSWSKNFKGWDHLEDLDVDGVAVL